MSLVKRRVLKFSVRVANQTQIAIEGELDYARTETNTFTFENSRKAMARLSLSKEVGILRLEQDFL